MLAVGLVVWYVLQRTPTGRRLYATGGNVNAARLAGVRTSRVIVLVAGELRRDRGAGRAADQRAAGGRRPDRRPGLPAARLRRRVPGVHPVPRRPVQRLGRRHRGLVLAVGVKGLQLAGAPVWIPDLFNGVALLLAVGLSKYQRTARRSAAVARILRRGEARS